MKRWTNEEIEKIELLLEHKEFEFFHLTELMVDLMELEKTEGLTEREKELLKKIESERKSQITEFRNNKRK